MSQPISRSRPFRYPALIVSIVLWVVVGAAMIGGIRSLMHSTDQVEHSYQVIFAMNGMQAALRTAESGARGYRRTGAPGLQADYLTAVPVALSHADTLVELTRENPEQLERIRQIQTVLHERLAELERLALPDTDLAEVREEVLTADLRYSRSRRLMVLGSEIIEAERAVLETRRADSLKQSRLLTAVVVVGILLPMTLLGFMMRSMLIENRRSRKLERRSRETVSELEALVRQRDRLSEQRRLLGRYAGMLQSCQDLDEAMAVTEDVISELLPHAGGRCYLLRASENIAATVARFGVEVVPNLDMLQPNHCWALRRGQPHMTDSEHGHVACRHFESSAELGRTRTVCVPLTAQGVSLGLLHLNSLEDAAGSEMDGALVEAIGEQLSLAIANLQLRQTLRLQSVRDPLTGLFNRRYLEENLSRELLRCQRRDLPLSVMMIDVDHFKRFNDEHGHAAGDALLAHVGRILREHVRGEDIACRYGGEEFILVLPETDADSARRRAEELRSSIGNAAVHYLLGTLGPVTVSIGVATFPMNGTTPETVLQSADQALYRAKNLGRNRVVSSGGLVGIEGGEPAASLERGAPGLTGQGS